MTQKQSGLFLLSMIVGVVWWMAMASMQSQNDLVRWVDMGPLTVVGEVVKPVRRAPDRLIMIVDVSRITRGKKTRATSGLLRLTWREANLMVHQGDHVEVVTPLREPYGTRNPGGFDYGRYLKRKGIHTVASVAGPDKVLIHDTKKILTTSWFWQSIDTWRDRVHQAAVVTLSDPALGLFLGMIIGEQSFISPVVRDAFMATGTVHIISISGSHLGLIAFLVFFLVRGVVLGLPITWIEWLSLRLTATRLAVLVTIPVVSFYTLLAGSEVATVRSWVMIIIFLVTVWLGRETHMLSALGIAIILAVLMDSQAIYDTSFQLSYFAVFAIALIMKIKRDEANDDPEEQDGSSGVSLRLWQRAKQGWWVTVAVTLVTLPLVAYYFNQIAWLGLVCNMVVVPYVGILVIPIGLLSVMWVLMTGAEILPLAFLNQAVSDGLVQVVTWLAHIPGAEWYVASPSIMSMLVFYGLLLAMVFSQHSRRLQMGCVVGVCAILVWWMWSPRSELDQNTVRVTFLDVGQGDATVVELPGGETILIDAGPAYRRLNMGKAVIGPYLWDRGIPRLDHVIATHPQWDHVGGLPWVLQSFEVGTYWSNGVRREQEFYKKLEQGLVVAGLQEQVAEYEEIIVQDGLCALRVINPFLHEKPSTERISVESGAMLNNMSLVTKLTCGPHSFLFTADVERDALNLLTHVPETQIARVIKVPHHGAKSSLHRKWVEQLEAEVAVVSVGEHNRFGHPYPSVVEAYAQKSIPLYRTDRDGAVWITANLDSPEIEIHTAVERMLKPVQFDASLLKNESENIGKLWKHWTGYL